MKLSVISKCWTFLLTASILAVASDASGQGPSANGQRSTKEGVYNREQWMRGRDIYAGLCASCHPAATHTGVAFTKSWAGKQLSELFGFLRERMPKSDPGSLSEQEYVDVISYMLRVNGMPQGNDELPADSLSLVKIRIDSSRVTPPE
jgi:mono/diheme cytochrome c family protein